MSIFNRKMILYKTKEEIAIMRDAAQVVSRTLGLIAKHMKEGVTPKQLDKMAHDYILSQDATWIFGFIWMPKYTSRICK